MAYNSAYKGSEIDAAVGAVKQKESTWDGKADKPACVSVTLTASGWEPGVFGSDYVMIETVAVSGVLADETAQLIIPTPALASQAAYIEAGILCTGQAANSLTFTCTTVPTADLTVYVVIQEVMV